MIRRPLKIGDKVRVYKGHWLRSGEVGKIIEVALDRGDHCWLVQFPTKIIGKGLDGDKLWLTEQCVTLERRTRK